MIVLLSRLYKLLYASEAIASYEYTVKATTIYRQGAMLAPTRLTNAGSCPSRQRCCAATAARSAETKGTALFLPVLPTPLRGYCCAVRQNERQL